MFVETTKGWLIPSENIASITDKGVLITKDGDSFYVDPNAIALLLRQQRPVIQAQPGWEVVTYIPAGDGDPEFIIEEEVIAWAFDGYVLQPILAEEGIQMEDPWIRAPSGRVTRYSRWFNTFDEWVTSERGLKAKASASNAVEKREVP